MKQAATDRSLFRQWSALVPIAMSLAGLALVLIFGLFARTPPQPDEGTPAHVWQLLMVVQAPIVLYFAIRWLPNRTRAALLVLLVQGLAWLSSLGALYIFEHGIAAR